MGYAEPQPKAKVNAGGFFLALAVIGAAVLLMIGAFFIFGFAFFAASPAPAPPMATIATADYTTVAVPDGSWGSEDLLVEIDQQGQTYYNGQALSLDEIRPRIAEARAYVSINPGQELIRIVEGCPFEHVERVMAMYSEMGVSNPTMTTVAPYRDVIVTLDEEGRAKVDGEPAESVHNVVQPIAAKHGARAKVIIRAHPKCPAEVVVRTAEACRQYGFGEVRVEGAKEEAVAERE